MPDEQTTTTQTSTQQTAEPPPEEGEQQGETVTVPTTKAVIEEGTQELNVEGHNSETTEYGSAVGEDRAGMQGSKAGPDPQGEGGAS